MEYKFSDFINKKEIKTLFRNLYNVANICIGIVEKDKKISLDIKNSINDDENISAETKYTISKYKNGVINIKIPIIIKGTFVATIICGRFPLDKLNDIKPIIEFSIQISNYISKLAEEKLNCLNKHKKIKQDYKELMNLYNQLYDLNKNLKIKQEKMEKDQEFFKITEERHHLSLLATNDAFYDWDIKNNKFYYSPKGKKMLGYNENSKDITLTKWKNSIHPQDKERVLNKFYEYLNKELKNYTVEYRLLKKDGSYLWVKDKGIALWDKNDKPIRIVGSHINIDNEKKWEKIVYNMAYYDSLTGLSNKTLFMNKLKKELTKGNSGAIFFIDLDNFKNINDTLGHEAGDELLKIVSKELKSFINDKVVISRFGGDEFLILHTGIKSHLSAANFVKKLLQTFKKQWIMDNNIFYVTSSIGITMFPKDGNDIYKLLKNADTAMYKAKFSGKNDYKFFDRSMYIEVMKKTQTEGDLRKAIKNNEFILFYQPEVDISTGKIRSLEALIRWNHPKIGIISPDKFIPLAEETGLIVPIGEWILETAFRQNKLWKDMGYNYETISINISTVQLMERNFLNTIKSLLKKTKLKPEFIELEITESALMKNINKNIEVLKKLRDLGMKITLDDFGTGYSSLNYLRKMPINNLKIDKSFIDNIHLNTTEEDITEGITLLAHKMQLQVIAEGVEKKEQLNILKEKNCDNIQGYYFSKPLFINEAENILKKGYFNL